MAEYHCVRLIVVNDNKDMITYHQYLSLGKQLDDPSSSPPQTGNQGVVLSDVVRFTMEDFDLAEKTLRILDEEEQLALEGRYHRTFSDPEVEEDPTGEVEQGSTTTKRLAKMMKKGMRPQH